MGSYNEEYARDNSGYFETLEYVMSTAVLQKYLLTKNDSNVIGMDFIKKLMDEIRASSPPFYIYTSIEYEIKLILERGGYKVE